MKIIGGIYKGKNFYMPAGIRPTQNVARKALFDILGQEMDDIVFLELFAGSGAVGLEAISRGAKAVTFVEKDPKCYAVIQENMQLLGINSGDYGLSPFMAVNGDSFAVIKMLEKQKKKFDIVFVDPPFSRGLAKKALKTLGGYDILQPSCIISIQHDKSEILPKNEGNLCLFMQKKYGQCLLSFYEIDTRR